MTALTSGSADIGLMGPEAAIYVVKQGKKEDVLEISQGYDISKAIIVDPFTEEYTEDDLAIVSGIYKKSIKGESFGDLTEHYQNIFNELDEFIQSKFKIAFGNRIMKQIKLFVID